MLATLKCYKNLFEVLGKEIKHQIEMFQRFGMATFNGCMFIRKASNNVHISKSAN